MTPPDRRALLIINTKSRTGNTAARQAMQGLAEHGIMASLHDCAAPDDLSDAIVRYSRNFDLVVIGGGDGTLNAAARGLVASGATLGIIPTGTANDLARTLGIPPDLQSAVDIIAAGNTRRIDLGMVNDRYFFNVASIGLSAQLAQDLTSDLKRRFGKLGYAIAAARVLMRARPFRVLIEGSGHRRRVFSLQVAVGNGRFYGGGNVVEQTAEITDGRLDLYSLEFVRAWRMALMFRSFRKGEHGAWREVRALKGQEFTLRTRRPRPVNADGEIVTCTPASFRVLPNAIKVIAP